MRTTNRQKTLWALVAGAMFLSDGARAAGAELTPDEQLREVALRGPGFGGIFLEKGVVNVWMTRGGSRERVSAAIGEVLGKDVLQRGKSVRFLEADYELAQLFEWSQSFVEILALDEVSFTDLDEGANRLRIGIEPKASPARILAILDEHGVPRDAVVFRKEDRIRYATTLRDSVRPVDAGLEISNGNGLCTISFNAEITASQTPGFVTCSHCTLVRGGVEPTFWDQPSGGSQIGEEIADPLYSGALAGCPAGRVCRKSDSAFAEYDANVASDLGEIARPGVWGSLNISNATPHYDITSPHLFILQGEEMLKVGRTTGKTAGLISDTCYTANVSASNITMLCQYHVDADPSVGGGIVPIVAGGDSGSPVFKLLGTGTPVPEVALYGVLWGETNGGSTWAFSSFAFTLTELSAAVGAFTVAP